MVVFGLLFRASPVYFTIGKFFLSKFVCIPIRGLALALTKAPAVNQESHTAHAVAEHLILSNFNVGGFY